MRILKYPAAASLSFVSEKCRITTAGQHSAPNSSLVKTARPFWTAHTGIALDLAAPQIFARRFAAIQPVVRKRNSFWTDECVELWIVGESIERICAPLCQQVPYCTLSRLYIWNGALYNKREVLRHAAQAACPSEKQMLDSVLNGNTVFFLRAPRQSIHGQGRGGSRRAAVRRRYGWARHGPQAHFFKP